MGDIYKDAFVTIAAHCAEDDSQGFLLTSLTPRQTVQFKSAGKIMGICRLPNSEADLSDSGLSRRAWVLRERYLSTRVLHFTAGQIYFETIDELFCDFGIIQNARRFGSLQLEPKKSSKLCEMRKILHSEPPQYEPQSSIRHEIGRTPSEWLDIVEAYCRCGLVVDRDKLIAISGMAQILRTHTSNIWCAGLWSDQICQGLLWMSEVAGLCRPTSVRAPTWSWAAWNGRIQYPTSVRDARFLPRCKFILLKNKAGSAVSEWLHTTARLVVSGKMFALWHPWIMELGSEERIGPGRSQQGIIYMNGLDMPVVSIGTTSTIPQYSGRQSTESCRLDSL
ncbi:hypothetical protein K491DRAFT_599462 [Lophiostoma macrostomum CBS 122681]|uniref:Heterokaryon incompatibility domain-containing protein n=1 Tax=Lophiostoma macrostomum CBS 122681 TaxID=1314788 RepID=A0A6A6T552_9PLEO|nr:hypothetical protein K491DRAFT_599462 [Lophiostoma macrostomum CBS 122681]